MIIIASFFIAGNRVKVSLDGISPSQLNFTWSTNHFIVSDYEDSYYDITANECGQCPLLSYDRNATCSNFVTDGKNCTFSVQIIVCGNIVGNRSNEVVITLTGNR